MASIRRSTNDGSYIDGFPSLRWGEWKDCSYAGAVAAVLNSIGIDATYEQVMGLSGACYRIAMTDNWCPSSAMLQVGYNSEGNANRAFGIDVYSLADEAERDEHVMQSIDSGIPVLTCGQRCEPEWSVICGYARAQDDTRFYGRTYFDYQDVPDCDTYTDNRYFHADRYPGEYPQALLRFYDRPCTPLSAEDALKVSLETCVRMFDQQSGYHKHGLDAYAILVSGFEKDDEEYLRDCRNDQYHIGSLMDARRAARVYLGDGASLLTGDNNRKLGAVSKLYGSMLDALLEVVSYEKTSAAFNGSASPAWDKATRARLANALREVAEMEQQARVIVSDVLENWG